MANDLSITVKVSGVDRLRRNLKRALWDIGDGREIAVMRDGHHRRKIAEVLELGAEPDCRMLAAAHLERFTAGRPDALYRVRLRGEAAAIAAGLYRAANPQLRYSIDQAQRREVVLAHSRVAAANFEIAAYEFSISMREAAEAMSRSIGRIGLSLSGVKKETDPIGWRRDQLIYYAYPDLLWMPVAWSDRIDDLLWLIYTRAPDRVTEFIYKRWRPS